MTSPLNHDATEKYFKDNKFFGLKAEDVFFFKQGTLPCLTNDGKLILETKAKVATAPDGNGGIYAALASSGALKDMEKRNVKWIMACSVDNALIQVADPAFIGLCEKRNAELGNKSCEKNAWNESVGVLGMKDDKYNVVEYSEITDEMAQSKGEDGSCSSAQETSVSTPSRWILLTKLWANSARVITLRARKSPLRTRKEKP